jgi:general secretion pathway protein D
MVFLRPMVIRNQQDSNALTMDRYDLIRSQQQTAGQPPQSIIMPVNGAPISPPMPPQEPGSPFRNGTVPPMLSLPETPTPTSESTPPQKMN